MSVTACNLINVEVDEDKDGYVTYTSRYEVHTNLRTDGGQTVLAYASVPTRTSTYAIPGGEADTSAACISRKATTRTPDESLKLWSVTIVHSNNPASSSTKDPEDPPENPWDEPPTVDCYVVKQKKAILKDLTGRIIASSAGEPYDPVQERDDTKYMLRSVRNQQTVPDLVTFATYRDAINTDVFAGCPAFTVKVETPGIFTRRWHKGVKYYTVTWEFSIDEQTFKLKLLDYGMYKVFGGTPLPGGLGVTGGELKVMKDLAGQPLSAPRLLDGAGGVLPIGDDPVELRPFEIYPLKAFGALGLTEFNTI